MAKYDFRPPQSIDAQYIASLRKVGKAAGHLVEAFVDGHKLHDEEEMLDQLRAYSKLIDPWARRQAKKMLDAVKNANKRSFHKKSKEMGKLLQLHVADGEVGRLANLLLEEQVDLITSIPLRAAERAQELAQRAFYDGTRANEIAEELLRSSHVSESQAKTIARTEVARANATITEARARSVGAVGYIWRTTLDGASRKSHREMNGKHVNYSDLPPKLSDGTHGQAGTFPNCRCYQEVFFG